MQNGLPYLSKELFWLAMLDISTQANLVSGHSWTELRDVLKRTTDYKYSGLISLVHQLAQNVNGPALPCRCCAMVNGDYDKENQWLSFDALKVVHQVTAVTWGERFSITLYTPGKLEHLTAQDWDTLAKEGFPIYMYEPLPAKMRRLTSPTHVMTLKHKAQGIEEHSIIHYES